MSNSAQWKIICTRPTLKFTGLLVLLSTVFTLPRHNNKLPIELSYIAPYYILPNPNHVKLSSVENHIHPSTLKTTPITEFPLPIELWYHSISYPTQIMSNLAQWKIICTHQPLKFTGLLLSSPCQLSFCARYFTNFLLLWCVYPTKA